MLGVQLNLRGHLASCLLLARVYRGSGPTWWKGLEGNKPRIANSPLLMTKHFDLSIENPLRLMSYDYYRRLVLTLSGDLFSLSLA